ncbi:MAG: thioredoxin family protein [Desulfovibrionaceae bacterium]|jgi:thiol-disulfide isomerase/thioredoxin|nr:thioredoxin family protein [Desulfovibrionaceae bacterium]
MTAVLPANTDADTLRALLTQTLAGRAGAGCAVICLCAAWCGACREFQPGFERAAAEHPHAVFRWLDIEDEAAALGDIDVETFPTLVIGGPDGQPRFAGPVPPQPAQIARLLQSLGL